MKGIFVRLLMVILVSSAAIALQQSAYAMCAQQPEDGNWKNVDPNTNSVTRIQLRFVCQDQVLNGQLYPPGPPWYVHVFGRCHPTDCNWGEVGAQKLSTGYIYATYNQGFAKRYVYAKMAQNQPGKLWVYIWTDFKDPNRKDYPITGYFIKE